MKDTLAGRATQLKSSPPITQQACSAKDIDIVTVDHDPVTSKISLPQAARNCERQTGLQYRHANLICFRCAVSPTRILWNLTNLAAQTTIANDSIQQRACAPIAFLACD